MKFLFLVAIVLFAISCNKADKPINQVELKKQDSLNSIEKQKEGLAKSLIGTWENSIKVTSDISANLRWEYVSKTEMQIIWADGSVNEKFKYEIILPDTLIWKKDGQENIVYKIACLNSDSLWLNDIANKSKLWQLSKVK